VKVFYFLMKAWQHVRTRSVRLSLRVGKGDC